MELYVDPVATTSRAVLALCRHQDLRVEIRTVSVMKGEHRTPAFAQLNPNQLVPVLKDGDFVLTESSAILRYLASRHGCALYPEALRTRARVDELIAWFETNFYRDFGYQYVYPQLMPHHGRGSAEATSATVHWGAMQAARWLEVLDRHFLRHGGPYLIGEELTIADFQGASILSLAELVDCSLERYPRVERWRAAMDALESWRGVNAPFRGLAQALQGRSYTPLEPADAAIA